MNKIVRITCIFLFFSLLFTDCKKKKQTEIVLEYGFALPNNLEIDTTNVGVMVERESYDFPTNLDGELAKNNTNKSKIKSAKLVFMRLQIAEWAKDSTKFGNFKDLQEVMVDVKKDGIGQQLVASKTLPDSKIEAFNLDLEDVELKEYLQQDNFRMVFKYLKRRAMPNEVQFVVSFRFRIVADPL